MEAVLGFDSPLWVGLGTVGLWAALYAFADRAKINNNPCDICGIRCTPSKFASYTQGDEKEILQELEDLRNLYAHNYVGDADEEYFNYRTRHVLKKDVNTAGASTAAKHRSICLIFGSMRKRWKACPHRAAQTRV